MKTYRKLASALAGALMTAVCAPAHAVDVSAGDLTAAKPGTNLALAYFQYVDRTQYEPDGGASLKADTHLQSFVGLARLVHYTQVGGLIVDPQIIVPVGTLYDGEVGGQKLKSTTGVGDVILTSAVWIVNKPDVAHATYVAVIPYVWVPVGSYDKGATLNLGENRWKYALGASVIQGVSDKVILDLIADVTWYGDNKDAGAGAQRLSQDASYQVQAFARYKINAANTAVAGLSGTWGGKQQLDGVYTGATTENVQARVAWQAMVTPTFQVETTLGRDLHAQGGFKEAARAQVRLLRFF